MMICEACGKDKGRDVRKCCFHPDAEDTCTPCYIGGKGKHKDHVKDRVKLIGKVEG